MLSMNVGQLVEVKLFDKPPSKKLGNELDEAVAVDAVVDVDDAAGCVELSELVCSDLDDSELFSVEAVDEAVETGISSVVVTEPDSALLLNSCSAGCSIVHPSSSRNGIRVSKRSSLITSGV